LNGSSPRQAVIGDVERPLTLHERIASNDAVQRLTILVALIVVWEIYARWLNNSLLFPTFSETVRTFGKDIANGVLIDRTFTSLRTLAIGYAFGLAFAAVFTTMAVASGVGTRILSTLTAMFNPLPAIALLPLALIWFGLGTPSLVFVIIHSVLWAVALNTLSGFRSVPETLRMSGRNVGADGRALCRPDSDPRRLSFHFGRPQDRLGLRLAHAGGGRVGLWRVGAIRGNWLVHF
jgi:NitT/TauT family transport system permease protein